MMKKKICIILVLCIRFIFFFICDIFSLYMSFGEFSFLHMTSGIFYIMFIVLILFLKLSDKLCVF